MSTRRILIIDDEEAILAVAKLSLKMVAEWDVVTATSGPEGVIKAESEQPEAILLDVMMPQMDGISTFKQLQANAKTQAIPVILLTAKAQAVEQLQYKQIGVTGVITKPFNSLTLANEMAELLDWRL
ncbi:MAG: response regulator [Leptolyngbyaceae cyanobacterium MO_188.B28]|nr:response regulator [Leptolyngbyaceae cyanobacterium MO_188.B28]